MSVRVGAPKARLSAFDVDYEPPSHGPFKCGTCPWFDPGGGRGKGDEPGDPDEPKGPHCEHPGVLGSAKVAPVESGGCCEFWGDTDAEAKQRLPIARKLGYA